MFHQNLRHTGLSPNRTATDTGSLKWGFTAGNQIRSSPALGADGTIYVGSIDHKLYAINPDGSEKWSFTAGAAVVSSPAR
jgi:large repetitive protein